MIREGLTFDDVLLVPQHSTVNSRSKDVDISVKMGKSTFYHPIIPANMKTVTGKDMADVICHNYGLAILHRFMPAEEQLEIAEYITDIHGTTSFAVSVGVKDSDRNLITKFVNVGIGIICIDIAHGDSKQCLTAISWIKENYPHVFLIAGNVATGEGAVRLWRAGADVVKVGIGPGSLCTTRIETGNGVPQLTALMDVCEKRSQFMDKKNPKYIIADGGIKSAGDIVKALCFSDMVMAGNLFAGCEETPGNRLTIEYRGWPSATSEEYI